MIDKKIEVEKTDIAERTFAYARTIIQCYRGIHKDEVGKILGRQLLRAGTSVGENVEEAQAAQSKADFISKISIAYKEAREALYWLRLIRDEVSISQTEMDHALDEAEQLVKILSTILLSSKQNPY